MTERLPTLATDFPDSTAPELSAAECADILNYLLVPPRFFIRQELQRGLTAQVFLVYDAEMERLAVAKIVVDDGRPPPPRCEHPLVPAVYDSRIHGMYRWSLQRYVPGTDLERLLRKDPQALGLHDRVRILHQIGETLAAAHEQGIVHLDVKPGNIVLAAHEDCALVDWESASRIGDTDIRHGTPGYMPPEQLDRRSCDHRSDIHALGATMVHLVCGRRPHRSGPWPKGRRYRQLRAIAATAMAEDPEQRYQSMSAMTADLRRWLAGLAPSVAPDPLTLRCLRTIIGHPAISSLVVIVIITLVTVGLLVHHQFIQTRRQWQTVYRSDFSQPLDPERWQAWIIPWWDTESAEKRPLNGPTAPWRVEDGALWARGDPNWTGCINLSLLGIGHPDLRLRWQVTPLLRGFNCNAYFGARREQSYMLHIAGYRQRDSVVLTGPPAYTVLATARLEQPIEAGRSYHIAWTYQNQEMQVHIDDRLVLAHRLLPGFAPVHIPAIGLEAAQDQLRIDHVQVDGLALPQLLDASQAADLLEARGHYASALELLQQLPAQPMRSIAQARCLLQLGKIAEGIRHLHQALEQQPGHPAAVALLARQAIDRRDPRQALAYLDRIRDPNAKLISTILPLLDQ
ncbi:MAG: protein kinase domain-containing protein, partial [Planctomycetota bacterium]